MSDCRFYFQFSHTHRNTDDPHLHTAVVISEMGITFNNQRRTSSVAVQGGQFTISRPKLDKLKDEAIWLTLKAWTGDSSADQRCSFHPCLWCHSGVPRKSLTKAWGLVWGQGRLFGAAFFHLASHHSSCLHTFWAESDSNIWMAVIKEYREQI